MRWGLLVIALSAAGCGDDTTGKSGDAPGGGGGVPTCDGSVQPSACPPGERKLDDGSCQPAGVPEDGCGVGFVHVDGSCVSDPPRCPTGLMALPGETACRPVAPCGAGPWGDFPDEPGTLYVDELYTVGDSDGTQLKPFPTIDEAIDVAQPGAIVAIAAGEYDGPDIQIPVRLWGKCPDETHVNYAVHPAVVAIAPTASGTELHDLQISGGQQGVGSLEAAVLVERVWIHDTMEGGVWSFDAPAFVELRDSLVENVGDEGVRAARGSVLISRSVIRNVTPDKEVWGLGVAGVFPFPPGAASIEVEQSLIEDVLEGGVASLGYQVAIRDTLIRGVAADTGAPAMGVLVSAIGGDIEGVVERSVIEDVDGIGVYGSEVTLTIRNTTMRGLTVPPDVSGGFVEFWGESHEKPPLLIEDSAFSDGQLSGITVISTDATITGVRLSDIAGGPTASAGIEVLTEENSGIAPSVIIDGCLLERTTANGIVTQGAHVVLTQTVVRDVAPFADGTFGRGFSLESYLPANTPTTATVEHCRVERATEIGMAILSSTVSVESVAIADTLSRPDGTLGRGVDVESRTPAFVATATLRHMEVDGSHELGIAAIAANVTIEASAVRNTQAASGLFGDGVSSLAYELVGVPATVTLVGSCVADSARAGVSVFGAALGLGNTILDCNEIDIDGEDHGGPFALDDLGNNRCGCGDTERDCKVVSTGISPVLPLP